MTDSPKYEIIIYWSQADEAFVAQVPELPGCAADGATYREAVENVEVVIQEWIETARALGRPVPARQGPADVRVGAQAHMDPARLVRVVNETGRLTRRRFKRSTPPGLSRW